MGGGQWYDMLAVCSGQALRVLIHRVRDSKNGYTVFMIPRIVTSMATHRA